MSTLEHGTGLHQGDHGHPHGHSHGTGHGDFNDTFLQHHFDDLEQQHESANLGMWAFLATEVLFFGGLLTAYAIFRWEESQRDVAHNMFVQASRFLLVKAGFLNTIVLLTSSLTMAFAVHFAALRDRSKTLACLLATFVLGAAFLGVKAYEWRIDYDEHLVPGKYFGFDWAKARAEHPHGDAESHAGGGAAHDESPASDGRLNGDDAAKPDGPRPKSPAVGESVGLERIASTDAGRAERFFLLYFFMTGLHALHMIIGLAMLAILMGLVSSRWMSGGGHTQIEMAGLYWHFVDIVWVFLYPLLYLIDIHK